MPRAARSLAALAVGLATLGWAATAAAEPQGTAGLTVGIAGAGADRALWDDTLFHVGLRGDVLFGREGPWDLGAGPYVETLSNGFADLQLGTGLAVLIPVIDPFPVVLSAGAYGRAGEDVVNGIEPGVAGSLFWGSRSYNYHGRYGMAVGLLTELRYGLGETRDVAIVLGAQLDIGFGSIPIVYAYNGLKGGSPETRPVK